MPSEYKLHVAATGMALLVARPRPWDLSARFAVEAIFYLSHRQNRQGNDLDNLLKTLLDAGNKVLWNDDRQVVECYLRKWPDSEDAHVGVNLRVSPVG